MDAFEWLILAAVVVLLGVLGMSLYETWGKECVKYEQQTTYILVGKIIIPNTANQCVEWKEPTK